jgi:uncharacterized protein YqhQ
LAPEPDTGPHKKGPRLKIGGMALENGVLFHTHRCWSMAVRTDAGEIKVHSGRKSFNPVSPS